MAEAGPEIPKVHEIVGDEVEHAGRYGRVIAVAVVLTTLIGALVAWGQADALRTHDVADGQAERYGALALSAAAIAHGQAQVQVDRFNLLNQQVRQANNALLFQKYGAASQANDLAAKRWNGVAKQTETDTVKIAHSQGIPYICSQTVQPNCPAANAFYSPEQDTSFPGRLQEATQWSSYRLSALRGSANQRAEDAESQFVHYAAALTMLAVAVFLFGYSLTPNGQTHRLLYSRVAAVFVVVAGVWGLIQALTPVNQPPDEAATAFANAEVANNTGDYSTAIADYTKAIELRPRFAEAYAHRANAEDSLGITHTGSGQNTQFTLAGEVARPSRDALSKAVADDRQALAVGSNSADVLTNANVDLLNLGMETHNQADLEDSYRYGQEAIARLKTQQHVANLLVNTDFNLAEVSLVLGRPQATHEFQVAEQALHAPDVNPDFEVSSALTDLNLIERSYPEQTARAESLKAEITYSGETYYDDHGKPYWTAADGGSVDSVPNKAVHFDTVKAIPDPAHAYYEIPHLGNLDMSRDVMSAQWQYLDPTTGVWTGIPEVSGPVIQNQLVKYTNTTASNSPSYLASSSPATCLPPGQYRVNLFVNGHLAGTGTATGNWQALKAVRFKEVDGATCVPADWQARSNPGEGSSGYVAPDRSGGAVILSIPKAAAGGLTGHEFEALERAAGGLNLPGLSSQEKLKGQYFIGLTDAGFREYWTYDSGNVYAALATAPTGQVYIGVTWAPSNDAAYRLLESVSPT